MSQSDPTIPPVPPDGSNRFDVTSDVPASPSASGLPTLPLSRSSLPSDLAPGALLLDRYRIIAPIGKGGMGEVYRADDLVLAASVALKFLPLSVSADPLRLDRFRSEVRLARQIAHPNICRVFDIAQSPPGRSSSGLPLPGRVFLSMEFVDGEDLSSLLRRIGRLPKEKAIEVARQLCLGLAAAHEQGVIHRDLKPANIMIDGRGRVRITDFGLAAAADIIRGSDAGVGTPLYMAPEQLAGREVSRQSDIYALGLVLYELFTGKPAHAVGDHASIADIRRLHESGAALTSPTALVADIDPIVERAILRCLEKDPAQRPASAIAVAAALPGGDPLAAALAAGQTPSPEMVAQSGELGRLAPALAWTCLALAVLALLAAAAITDAFSLLRRVPMELSPDVLTAKSKDILRTLGYVAPPADAASGFAAGGASLNQLVQSASGAELNRKLAAASPPVISFWYRQAPVSLVPDSIFQRRAAIATPAPFVVGSISMQLDTTGRLVLFEAVPPSYWPPSLPAETAQQAPGPPNWAPLFAAAGLKMEDFQPAPSQRSPWHASDTRAAWLGSFPGDPSIPMRIEAAAEHGQVTSFRILAPWHQPERTISPDFSLSARLFTLLDSALFSLLLVGGAILSYVNLRAGRGDRRGANRLAAFVLAAYWLSTVLFLPTIAHMASLEILQRPLAFGLWHAAFAWLVYVALEPIVRRTWPSILIGWARVLDGRFRDVRVGRDLLLGGLGGLALLVLARAIPAVPWLLGAGPITLSAPGMDRIESARFALAGAVERMGHAAFVSVAVAFLLVGLLWALRRESRAAVAVGLVIASMLALESGLSIASVVFAVIASSVFVAALLRLGVVGFWGAFFVFNVLNQSPLTLDLSAWWFPSSAVPMLIAAAPMVYGFLLSLPPRSARPALTTPAPAA